MPFVNVKVAGNLTMEQKRQISDEISDTMLRVAGKPKPSCYIVFDEVSRDNWAKGDVILSDADKAAEKEEKK
jgi:4-oxalocrotonate tautomerase